MTLSPQATFYYVIALSAISLICLIWCIWLQIKIRRILGGKSAKDIEATILEIHKNVAENAKFRSDMEAYLLLVEKRLRRAFQSVETIRFDAFAGTATAGNQSFASCFVNEKGDGVIISSLSARERVNVFSKAIKDWKSAQELSPEEKDVLSKAKAKLEQ